MTALLSPEVTQVETTAPAGHGRLRAAWRRIRLVLADMSYGARRAVEVQAPWIVDDQWYNR
jgi:hypothetical protein